MDNNISAAKRAMSFTKFGVLGPVALVCACGPSPEQFAHRCEKIAGIEVQNYKLWSAYLRERKEDLTQRKVTENGNEIDATDIDPVVDTRSFRVTNDWVLSGRPNVPTRKPFRNDEYIVEKASGKPVAKFRNLLVQIPSIAATISWSCTANYPHLYTGGAPHRGTIGQSSR
jgi:hypothetical protein